jgi:hypothetical protein
VTYYSNKNTGGAPQHFQNFNGQIDHSLPAHHNNYVQHGSVMNSPNGVAAANNAVAGSGGNGDTSRHGGGQGQNNNIFVPGTMRFANMNRGGKGMNDSVISNQNQNSLTA